MPFYCRIITAVFTLRCFIILTLHYTAVYDSSGVSHDLTNITLALRTLGTFDFEDHSLTKLLRHCADKFLGSDNEEVYLTVICLNYYQISPGFTNFSFISIGMLVLSPLMTHPPFKVL